MNKWFIFGAIVAGLATMFGLGKVLPEPPSTGEIILREEQIAYNKGNHCLESNESIVCTSLCDELYEESSLRNWMACKRGMLESQNE